MKINPLIASQFISDGGSMFGLVPKPIWSRLIPADERNGIRQNANVLLVRLDDGRQGLIDTGCGDPDRFDDKALSLHGMNRTWPLMDALAQKGLTPEHIDFILYTHLHWDHAGGSGRLLEDGSVSWTFPNATHYLHAQEWHDATAGDRLLYKSYPSDVIEPLRRLPAEQRVLIEDTLEPVLPGIRLIRSSGHTAGHSAIHLESDALELDHPDAESFGHLRHVIYCGDVCPTQHHLRMVFQTAYDTYPLDTRSWKQEWLTRAAQEDIALFLDHDPDSCAIRIAKDPRREFVVTQRLPATAAN